MIFTLGTLFLFLVQLALLSNLLVLCSQSRKKKHQKAEAQRQAQYPRRYAQPQPPPPQRSQFAGLVSERSMKTVAPVPPAARAVPYDNSVRTASRIRTPSKLQRGPSASIREQQQGAQASIRDKRQVAPPASPSLDATQKSMRATPKKQANLAVAVAAPAAQPLQIVEPSGKPMKLEPSVLRWKPDGGIQTVSIKNFSHERQAVKVKCSDNQLYRVNPVYSFIEPGKSLEIDILRQSGPAKVDRMVFVTTKAKAADDSPGALFDSDAPIESMVLPLVAQSS